MDETFFAFLNTPCKKSVNGKFLKTFFLYEFLDLRLIRIDRQGFLQRKKAFLFPPYFL